MDDLKRKKNEILLKYDELDGDRSVVLEDDTRVAYAYLLKEGEILADVWLYNAENAPSKDNWQSQSAMPFLNPAKYCVPEKCSPLRQDSNVICVWSTNGVNVIVDGVLYARMDNSVKPGWSRQAQVSGPLAKPLGLSVKDSDSLGGETLTADDVIRLQADLSLSLPSSLISHLLLLPLTGVCFSLDDEQDESGLGADFRWMTLDEILDEATQAYPGIVARRHGYLPIGICLEGSGDPYFLRIEDGTIVRIPHQAAINDELDFTQIEPVIGSIVALINKSEIS